MMGPMKPHHMLPDAILQSIFNRLNTKRFPTIMLGDFSFEDLAQAAELGCNFCTSVKAGVLALHEVIRCRTSMWLKASK